ncbi:GNAT family N-acetyltransferase [Planctomonas psychrotolerans]|uniref:GNAT family N-acetyltransferase n=1 Tax=Planctomonas psychrotolerans TaxID=2528712 RepID=UPI00123A0EFF|nr:GNAT family N-acetyltransferase [Planctomonas psychrotolerans]
MKVEEYDWDDQVSVRLRAAQQLEIAERYGTTESEPGVPPSAADIAVFFVATSVDGEPLGCGGLRYLGGGEAEIKRMYVLPAARGHGVATAILGHLEDHARHLGWLRLKLETGEQQPDAMRFYEREGYTRIANFGAYAGVADSVCYAKDL